MFSYPKESAFGNFGRMSGFGQMMPMNQGQMNQGQMYDNQMMLQNGNNQVMYDNQMGNQMMQGKGDYRIKYLNRRC